MVAIDELLLQKEKGRRRGSGRNELLLQKKGMRRQTTYTDVHWFVLCSPNVKKRKKHYFSSGPIFLLDTDSVRRIKAGGRSWVLFTEKGLRRGKP